MGGSGRTSATPIDVTIISSVKNWSMAPFRTPSTEHLLGTLAIGGEEEGDAIVIEWDLAENKEIHRTKVASGVRYATMTSHGGHLFLATSGEVGQTTKHVLLFELDASLGVVDRRELGIGGMPSIAVNEKWIVASYLEERTAIPESITSPTYGFTTHHAMHVTAVKRADGTLAGSQIFRGPHMLMPPGDPAHAMHAIALRGDNVYLALPGAGEVTVEATRIPSFVVTKERTLSQLGAGGLADIRFRGAELEVMTTSGGEKHRFTTALAPRKMPEETEESESALAGVSSCQETVIAWNHRVTMCETNEGTSVIYAQ